ncbi:hypothetical protein DND90_13070 [Pseudomonas syringae pv. maculicola]|nr:hypothetical protein DND90_13070 [Pseudomonas syringae pv. maculicola]
MRSWTAALVALIGAANASAAVDYRCTIERVVAASEGKSNQMYINKQFSVDRQTGLMIGALKNSYVTNPQVLDHGSLETSFKVVTTMRKDQGAGAGSNIYALTINEYQDGPRKPFIFLNNDEAFLGWCEHF